MSACACLSSVLLAGAKPVNRPVVMLDGVIEPRLVVQQFNATGPLDERQALLSIVEPIVAAEQWLVVQPLRLCDGMVRHRVLVCGRLPTRVDDQRVELRDSWSNPLDEPLGQVPTLSREGTLIVQSGGWFAHTRSEQRYDIDGHEIYVLAEDAESWTVRQVLESLSTFAALNLNLNGLPKEAGDAPLVSPIDLTLSLRRVLEQVLEPYGLRLARDLSLEGQTLIERRHVRSLQQGRSVRLRWTRQGQPLGDVLRIHKRQPRGGARLWQAEANGPVVESTFELIGGWDPSLQGAAADEYDRAASSDFSRYANVYRNWVLNEDGAYSNEPFIDL